LIVEKISLYNFKKYKKSDIDFGRGIMGIFGNNGAGKSTIFDGITWALYGKTQATELAGLNQEDLIRDGEEQMGVELLFSLGGNKYRISRYLDKRGVNAKLWMNKRIQATKTREVGEMIEKVLGLDSKAFVASSFIRQKEIDLLSSKRSSERRGIINRLFNLKIYEKFEKSAKEKKKFEELETKSLSGKKEIFEKEIEQIKVLGEEEKILQKEVNEIFNEYNDSKDNLERKERELKVLEEEKRIYDENVKKREVLSEKLRSRKEYLEVLNRDLGDIKRAEEEYKKKIPEYKKYKEIKQYFKEIDLKRDNYTKLKNQLKIEENTLETEIKNIVSNIKKIEENIKDNSEKIKKFEEMIKELPEIRTKIKVYKELKLKVGEHENSIEKIIKKINDIEQHLTKYNTEKNTLFDGLNEIEGVGIGKKCPLCKRELDEEHYIKLTSEYKEKIREKELNISRVSKTKEKALELLNEKKEERDRLKSDLQDIENLRERENILSIHESNITSIKGEIEKLENNIEVLKKEKESIINEKNAKIKKIKGGIEETHFEEEEYLRLKKELEEKEEIEKEVSAFKEKISKKGEIENRVSTLNKEIEKIKKFLQGIYEVIERKKENAEKYKELKEELEKIRKSYLEVSKKYTAKSTELKSLQKRIKELESKKKELKDIEIKIKQKEEKIREYSILSEAFTSIPVSIQNRLKPRIALETSQLVDEMTEGKYSEIELDEDYGILVGYDNELYPVSRFSGGEKDLINLCLRIAVSRVLVSLSSEHGFSHVQSLFLDEVFSSLDSERRQSLLKALYKLQNHFEQILIITHVEDIKTSVPYAINIEELDGYSVVKSV